MLLDELNFSAISLCLHISMYNVSRCTNIKYLNGRANINYILLCFPLCCIYAHFFVYMCFYKVKKPIYSLQSE